MNEQQAVNRLNLDIEGHNFSVGHAVSDYGETEVFALFGKYKWDDGRISWTCTQAVENGKETYQDVYLVRVEGSSFIDLHLSYKDSKFHKQFMKLYMKTKAGVK